MSGRNGRMARAVALSDRDVRRVGLTAHASRAVGPWRRSTTGCCAECRGPLENRSRTAGDSSPAAAALDGQPAPAPAAPELPPRDLGRDR